MSQDYNPEASSPGHLSNKSDYNDSDAEDATPMQTGAPSPTPRELEQHRSSDDDDAAAAAAADGPPTQESNDDDDDDGDGGHAYTGGSNGGSTGSDNDRANSAATQASLVAEPEPAAGDKTTNADAVDLPSTKDGVRDGQSGAQSRVRDGQQSDANANDGGNDDDDLDDAEDDDDSDAWEEQEITKEEESTQAALAPAHTATDAQATDAGTQKQPPPPPLFSSQRQPPSSSPSPSAVAATAATAAVSFAAAATPPATIEPTQPTHALLPTPQHQPSPRITSGRSPRKAKPKSPRKSGDHSHQSRQQQQQQQHLPLLEPHLQTAIRLPPGNSQQQQQQQQQQQEWILLTPNSKQRLKRHNQRHPTHQQHNLAIPKSVHFEQQDMRSQHRRQLSSTADSQHQFPAQHGQLSPRKRAALAAQQQQQQGRGAGGAGAGAGAAGAGFQSPSSDRVGSPGTPTNDDPGMTMLMSFLEQQPPQQLQNVNSWHPMYGLDKVRPGDIAKRTRSQLPMDEASWDDLDFLNTDEMLPELNLQEGARDDDYNRFITNINNDELVWGDEETEDAEYDYLADEARATEQPDEYRKDKSVKISKHELKKLEQEAALAGTLGKRKSKQKSRAQKRRAQVKAERAPKRAKWELSISECAKRFMPQTQKAGHSVEQMKRVKSQVRQQFQLLLQQLSLSVQPSVHKDKENEAAVRGMLRALEQKHQAAKAQGNIDSPFHIVGLEEARAAVEESIDGPDRLRFISDSPIDNGTDWLRLCSPCLQPELKEGLDKAVKEDMVTRTKWYPAEDKLLAVALILSSSRESLEDLPATYLPIKTLEQVRIRIQNLTARKQTQKAKHGDNPLLFLKEGKQTLEEFKTLYLEPKIPDPQPTPYPRAADEVPKLPPRQKAKKHTHFVETSMDSQDFVQLADHHDEFLEADIESARSAASDGLMATYSNSNRSGGSSGARSSGGSAGRGRGRGAGGAGGGRRSRGGVRGGSSKSSKSGSGGSGSSRTSSKSGAGGGHGRGRAAPSRHQVFDEASMDASNSSTVENNIVRHDEFEEVNMDDSNSSAAERPKRHSAWEEVNMDSNSSVNVLLDAAKAVATSSTPGEGQKKKKKKLQQQKKRKKGSSSSSSNSGGGSGKGAAARAAHGGGQESATAPADISAADADADANDNGANAGSTGNMHYDGADTDSAGAGAGAGAVPGNAEDGAQSMHAGYSNQMFEETPAPESDGSNGEMPDADPDFHSEGDGKQCDEDTHSDGSSAAAAAVGGNMPMAETEDAEHSEHEDMEMEEVQEERVQAEAGDEDADVHEKVEHEEQVQDAAYHAWTREQDMKILLFWQGNGGWDHGESSHTLLQNQPEFTGTVTAKQIDNRFDELFKRLVDESKKNPALVNGEG